MNPSLTEAIVKHLKSRPALTDDVNAWESLISTNAAIVEMDPFRIARPLYRAWIVEALNQMPVDIVLETWLDHSHEGQRFAEIADEVLTGSIPSTPANSERLIEDITALCCEHICGLAAAPSPSKGYTTPCHPLPRLLDGSKKAMEEKARKLLQNVAECEVAGSPSGMQFPILRSSDNEQIFTGLALTLNTGPSRQSQYEDLPPSGLQTVRYLIPTDTEDLPVILFEPEELRIPTLLRRACRNGAIEIADDLPIQFESVNPLLRWEKSNVGALTLRKKRQDKGLPSGV